MKCSEGISWISRYFIVIAVLLVFTQSVLQYEIVAQEIDNGLPICNRSRNFFTLNSSSTVLQNFSSPNYPANYPTYSYCIWVLTAPIGQLVKLTFSSFAIYSPSASSSKDCPYAYVKVTEQDKQGNSQVVGSFCGDEPPQTIYSSGGSLRVEFKNTFRASAKGFVAKYAAIQPGTACSEHNSFDENTNILMDASTGRIVTPQFSDSYSKAIDCTWKITLPPKNGINMSFHSFKPKNQVACSGAALEVYNGRFGHGHGAQLGVFCESSLLPVIYSAGRYMSLRWRAKNRESAIDFEMDFRSIQQKVNGSCDQIDRASSSVTMDGVGGSIFSPGYPEEYPNNKECSWHLSVPSGFNVRLKFLTFQLESSGNCKSDFVEVRDGESSTSPLKHTFCGSSLPPVLISKGRHMYVSFKSNYASSGKGFLAVFEATTEVPKIITTPWVQPGVCSPDYTPKVNNNLKLSGTSGVVLSPLYPSQYPDSISCTWQISVPNGKRIRLEFDDFWIDDQHGCHGDYLEVRDGPGTSSPMLGDKYCGNKNPGEIYSTGSSIRLQFVSDASGTSHGFKARYEAVSKPFNRFIAVGIAIGAIVLVLIGIFIYCKIKKKRSKDLEDDIEDYDDGHGTIDSRQAEIPGNPLLSNGTETPHNNTTPNDYSVNYVPRPVAMETLLNDEGNIKNNLSEEEYAWFKPSKRKSKGFE